MYRFQLFKDSVVFSDTQPQRKRSRECYDRVAPTHIPRIKVTITIQDNTEMISIAIPMDVAKRMPFLRNSVISQSESKKKQAGNQHDSKDDSAILDLPVGAWGLLIVLSVMMDSDLDMDEVLLAPTTPPLAAESLAVRLFSADRLCLSRAATIY